MNDTDGMSLQTALGSVSKKMLADFKATGALKHSGSKGAVRESLLLHGYLSKYLPRTVIAAHSGEVIAVDAGVSSQCDLLVLDPSTPPFWDEDGYRVVPIECVYGVIEVKSFLDARELRETWSKIAEIKRMEKNAFRQHPGFSRSRTIYGKAWGYVPTSGMVFAYDGAELETLGSVNDGTRGQRGQTRALH